MTACIIFGTAMHAVKGADEDETRVRWYTDRLGGTWLGTETWDVEYYCGDFCLDLALGERDIPGESDSYVDLKTMQQCVLEVHVTTMDIVRIVKHAMPDYDVHCATCKDLIHRGRVDA